MNLQAKLFPWSVLLNIALIIALFFIFRANSSNQQSAALDRDRLLAGNAHLKSELALRDTAIWRIQNDRTLDSAEHAVFQGGLKTQIKGLRGQLSRNPESLVIRDTIILKQDTLITDLENERDSLKMSYDEEIKLLQQSKKDLTTAYDSTFNDLLSTNDRLISALKKVEELTVKNKVVTWVAVLEAVGIVILALLL